MPVKPTSLRVRSVCKSLGGATPIVPKASSRPPLQVTKAGLLLVEVSMEVHMPLIPLPPRQECLRALVIPIMTNHLPRQMKTFLIRLDWCRFLRA